MYTIIKFAVLLGGGWSTIEIKQNSVGPIPLLSISLSSFSLLPIFLYSISLNSNKTTHLFDTLCPLPNPGQISLKLNLFKSKPIWLDILEVQVEPRQLLNGPSNNTTDMMTTSSSSLTSDWIQWYKLTNSIMDLSTWWQSLIGLIGKLRPSVLGWHQQPWSQLHHSLV